VAGRKKVRRIDLRGKNFPLTIIILAKEAKSLSPKSSLLVITDDLETVEQAREWGERVSWADVSSRKEKDYWVLRVMRT